MLAVWLKPATKTLIYRTITFVPTQETKIVLKIMVLFNVLSRTFCIVLELKNSTLNYFER